MITLKVKSYAKINLGLWIWNKMSNGYHLIQSVFMMVDWSDELSFEWSNKTLLKIDTRDGIELSSDDNNMCIKAVRLFQKETHQDKEVAIHLKKNIPIGAGLGGGSGNAATVLLALNYLWQVNMPLDRLAELGTKIGADVPFFIYRAPLALVEGIGEKITPMANRFPYWIVVAFSNQNVSTAWAYQNLNQIFPKPKKSEDFLRCICKGEDLESLENSFEKNVLDAFPKIKELKNYFYELGADVALMSGSGGAVFGIFKNSQVAKKCFDEISVKYPSAYSDPLFYINPIIT